ncbi:ATP-binding cassette domain-containing protein [Anaerosporobacter faecicola]|uniref:ATP-binding cassette domain-containing protein n=1 Tax=Anaerosporobacter faecicola TaxID=2718714 RepID=UPI00143C8344|nr:ATP-binding cassette domain-containing protein [Anaerosporobacter faecicola]
MYIEVKNLCKQYNGLMVLKDYSYRFSSGMIHCIMGESGKGKTTLFRILLGLTDADEGELIGVKNKKIRAVFQEDRLLEENTIIDNLLFVLPTKRGALKRRLAEISEACEAVGLGSLENKPVKELSGGMKRRVAILRALLSEYDILLMDEPLKGLDQKNKQLVASYIQKRLLEEKQEKIVIMVTHDQEDVELVKGNVCYL